MKITKLLAILIAIALTLCYLSACGQESKSTSGHTQAISAEQTAPVITESETHIETQPLTTEVPTTVVPKLSEACDKVMAIGTDADGNFYELVANETEDYTGTTIEMGVIKNNEWSINMTTNSPFISEDGLLFSASCPGCEGSIFDNINDELSRTYSFTYIGYGCFYSCNTIWNGNNGNYYCNGNNEYDVIPEYFDFNSDCYSSRISDEKKYFAPNYVNVINNSGKIVLDPWGEEHYRILDLDTMQIKDTGLISAKFATYTSIYSEGLFAIHGWGRKDIDNGFYDENGNRVIDLTEYIICDFNFAFENGECKFTIQNDQGTYYLITIDKEGNVLNSVEVNN